MKFEAILEETGILNEIKIDILLKKYNQGRFKYAKNVSNLIGTIIDDDGDPLTYEEAEEYLKNEKEYSSIPKDLKKILKQGTNDYESALQYASVEKTRQKEVRSKMTGGSIIGSRKYA